MIERLIADTAQPQLDPDGIALGLIGVLEMLWQDFCLPDRERHRPPRGEAALHGVSALDLPGAILAVARGAHVPAGAGRFAGWVYDNAPLFAAERDSLFHDSWQFAGHRTQIPRPGDFLAVDLGIERILIVRGAPRERGDAGDIRAFRNSCSDTPHILETSARGQVKFIQCAVHGLEFGLDGKRRSGRGADLTGLDLRLHRRLDFRPCGDAASACVGLCGPLGLLHAAGGMPGRSNRRWKSHWRADWKLVAEQWLSSAPHRLRASREAGSRIGAPVHICA